MENDRTDKGNISEQLNEKHLLQNQYTKPIVLVTYEGNVLIEEKIRVLRYDHIIDGAKATSKLNVLFAFPFNEYEIIKAGITLNKKVEAQKLQPITKRSDRPKVVTKEEYDNGIGANVQVTMRSGHVLSGYQLHATRYNLIVKINEKIVLVYKHGILEYQIQQEA